jgi:uncharacterized protein YjiS (DUF1127 family)
MTIAERHRTTVPRWRRFLQAARATVAIWRRRRSTRAALRELEPHLLADIGKNEKEWRHECAKWFR